VRESRIEVRNCCAARPRERESIDKLELASVPYERLMGCGGQAATKDLGVCH
jgi:hypothetical protein